MIRRDPPPASKSIEPRYLRPLKATVAPPDDADSDERCVVPLRGLVEASLLSELVDSTAVGAVACPVGSRLVETPAMDATDVTMGAVGTPPSGTGFAAPITAVGTGFAEPGFAGPALIGVVSLVGEVGVGELAGAEVAVPASVADVAGTVITEDTIGVSVWKRSTAFTVSFSPLASGDSRVEGSAYLAL